MLGNSFEWNTRRHLRSMLDGVRLGRRILLEEILVWFLDLEHCLGADAHTVIDHGLGEVVAVHEEFVSAIPLMPNLYRCEDLDAWLSTLSLARHECG